MVITAENSTAITTRRKHTRAPTACQYESGRAMISWLARREKKRGKARALGAFAARLGRAVYHMLRKKEAFDAKRFFAS